MREGRPGRWTTSHASKPLTEHICINECRAADSAQAELSMSSLSAAPSSKNRCRSFHWVAIASPSSTEWSQRLQCKLTRVGGFWGGERGGETTTSQPITHTTPAERGVTDICIRAERKINKESKQWWLTLVTLLNATHRGNMGALKICRQCLYLWIFVLNYL